MKGIPGDNGAPGLPGRNGTDGTPGRDGMDGRDGLEVRGGEGGRGRGMVGGERKGEERWETTKEEVVISFHVVGTTRITGYGRNARSEWI